MGTLLNYVAIERMIRRMESPDIETEGRTVIEEVGEFLALSRAASHLVTRLTQETVERSSFAPDAFEALRALRDFLDDFIPNTEKEREIPLGSPLFSALRPDEGE